MSSKEIFVYSNWHPDPLLIGKLQVDVLRGKEVYAFTYDDNWLKSNYNFYIDPDIQNYPGYQYPAGKSNFGIFLDSSPDRWGRTLMQRREAIIAKQENRTPKKLNESDFMLGVQDDYRLGALRFKTRKDGVFESQNENMPTPPFATLRELETACMQFENDIVTDSDSHKWLQILMAPGSSLGGARPKANVADESKNLWIAKFPAKNDTYDIGAWEFVSHLLAKNAGLITTESSIIKLNSNYRTFIIKRFDREKQTRIHFASAMALLGFVDGQENASYLHMAEFIQKSSVNTTNDLKELWKRIVFNISIKNTDDHLRNHGFLLTPSGWTLSPVYDLNPVPNTTGLSINISETDNSLHMELAYEVAPFFGINLTQAKAIEAQIKASVSKWNTIAKMQGISRNEIEMMENAFNQSVD